MAKAPSVVVTLRVPENIRALLRAAAEGDHRSTANTVEVLILKHCRERLISVTSKRTAGRSKGYRLMYSMKNRLLLCGFALTLLPECAIAHEFKPLEGEYAIGSKTILDPPPGEKKDRLFLYLQGKAAEDTFNAMPQRVSAKVCGEDQVMKQAGGLQCLRTKENAYYCSVGILLDSGRSVTGSVC